MAPVRAVTLDLFGTLVDFSVQRDEPPLVRELLDEMGCELDEHDVLAVWLRESLDERARLPFRTVHQALVQGARRAGGTLELALDPERWAAALEERWAASPLQADAAAFLDALDEAGLPRVVVTNLDQVLLDRVLASTGLIDRIHGAVCSQRARAYKPHPRPFRLALELLDRSPGSVVHVGNSATEDRAGAHAAGMRCVLVRDGRGGLLDAFGELLG